MESWEGRISDPLFMFFICLKGSVLVGSYSFFIQIFEMIFLISFAMNCPIFLKFWSLLIFSLELYKFNRIYSSVITTVMLFIALSAPKCLFVTINVFFWNLSLLNKGLTTTVAAYSELVFALM